MEPSPDRAALRAVFDNLPPDVVRFDELADTTTQAERRRLQNRLNQRALRKRKREAAKQTQYEGATSLRHLTREAKPLLSKADAPNEAKFGDSEVATFQELGFWELVASAMSKTPVNRYDLMQLTHRFPVEPDDITKLLDSFRRWMYAISASSSPGRDTLFTLVQFNVFRALDSNARHLFLARTHALEEDSESRFTDPRYSVPDDIPPSLRPTTLQRTVEHHPWIDLLPLPRMRDNLIRAGESYDEEELCTGLLGCSLDSDNKTGVVVWGEAWDPAGWELTEEFLEKWGWVVNGCDELIKSTNKWRTKRGKEELKLEL